MTVNPAGVYRCADCGDGHQLMAWAPALAYGPVGTDGDLAAHDDVWDEGICEDSIQCTTHPDGVIEKQLAGEWCRWWRCPWCGGDGRSCPAEGYRPPGSSGHLLSLPHEGWRPAAEIEALPALPGAGPGHVFDLAAGQPARTAHCRICTTPAGSTAGGRSCPGDRHVCPAMLPGPGPGARQVHGRPGWFCYQPGTMNEDLTAWTCQTGHVITRGSHGHHAGRCVIPQACPRNDLATEGSGRCRI